MTGLNLAGVRRGPQIGMTPILRLLLHPMPGTRSPGPAILQVTKLGKLIPLAGGRSLTELRRMRLILRSPLGQQEAGTLMFGLMQTSLRMMMVGNPLIGAQSLGDRRTVEPALITFLRVKGIRNHPPQLEKMRHLLCLRP